MENLSPIGTWGNAAGDPAVAENHRRPKNMHAIKIIKTTKDRRRERITRTS
jgi:hypothetical protein